jgi:hypothetical protein
MENRRPLRNEAVPIAPTSLPNCGDGQVRLFSRRIPCQSRLVVRCLDVIASSGWKRKRKYAPHPYWKFRPRTPADRFHRLPNDAETEAAAVGATHGVAVRAVELLK